MPTSQKRIEANRRNAQMSTGPRSEEGKARSRFNGARHGLAAGKMLVLHEDAAEFADFCRAMVEDRRPVGALETALAERVAAKAWRLKRTEWMEAALLNRDLGAAQNVAMHKVPEKHRIGWHDEPNPIIVGIELGKELERQHSAYETLRRYERTAERGLYQAIRELERVQDRRKEGDRGPGTGDRGIGTGDRGIGTGDRGTGTGEHGTGNREPGLGIGEQGAGTGRQGTESDGPNPTAPENPMRGDGLEALNSCLQEDLRESSKEEAEEDEEQRQRDEGDEWIKRQIMAMLEEEEAREDQEGSTQEHGRDPTPPEAAGRAPGGGVGE